MFGSSNIVDLLTEYISYLKIVRETEVYHNAKRSQAKESIDIYGRLWVRWNYIYVTLVGWIKSQGRHQPTKPSDICQRNGSQC